MPLSKPAHRRHMHTREIVCRGYKRDDGLWDIEGRITDTKSYSFPNRDRGGIAAGEPLHDMLIRLTMDGDRTIHKAEAATEHSPYNICPHVTESFSKLEGLKSQLQRVSTRSFCKSEKKRPKDFRTIIDPAQSFFTDMEWPKMWVKEKITDFTLNNNYVIFKASSQTWSLSFD